MGCPASCAVVAAYCLKWPGLTLRLDRRRFASSAQELRALLEDRGVECRGCAEKADLVARVEETYHLPLKPRTEWKGPASGGGKKRSDGVPDMDDPEVAELVRKLQSQMKGNGMGDSFKMFTGKDFEGLSPEEMQKKFDGEL